MELDGTCVEAAPTVIFPVPSDVVGDGVGESCVGEGAAWVAVEMPGGNVGMATALAGVSAFGGS